MKSNVFTPWLSRLRKLPGPAPKAVHDHQFYMRHPQHKGKVSEEYNRRFPSRSAVGADMLKERNKVAWDLLSQETEAVREALKKEAADELKAAKERYEAIKKGLPSDVPEDVEE
jgi:hypothetical protein